MKKDYKSMSYDELHSEFGRLNRKLIVPNILIAIIALIACIAQLFMPFFEMTVHLNGEVVSTVIDYVFEDDDDVIVETDNEIMSAILTKSNIKTATSDLDCSFSFNISAQDLLTIAFASEETVEDDIVALLADLLDDMNIKDEIESALNAMMPSVISVAVTSTITSLSEELDLTEEQTAIVEQCGEDIQAAVQKLANAEELTDEVKEEVKSDVKTSVSDTMTELGYTEEDIESVSDVIDTYYDAFLDSATDDEGNFSYMTMLENIDTLIDALSSEDLSDEDLEDLLDDYTNSGEESAIGGIVLAGYTLTDDSASTSTSDSESLATTINYYLSLLDDSEALVREILGEDALDSQTIQIIQLASEGIFIFIAVISAMWALLALLSILHIFIHNKKVGMWYVKLFGGLAAFLFFLIPAVMIIFLNSYSATLASALGVDASIFTTIANALSFGGAEIIVLVCLLALWIISIFWCHPIKKRIKRYHKELKHAKKEGR